VKLVEGGDGLHDRQIGPHRRRNLFFQSTVDLLAAHSISVLHPKFTAES
jgi:hypothetical protein